jgi:hypothetical protein
MISKEKYNFYIRDHLFDVVVGIGLSSINASQAPGRDFPVV